MNSSRTIHHGLGQLVEQHVGFAIEHTVALLNGRLADGLGQVALARATRSKEQCVFALADESASSQVVDQTAIHLGIEVEVEVIERLLRIPEGGLLAPPFQQAVAAPAQLVGDQARDQIDRRHGFALGLAQSRFQHGGDAAEPQLP
jgi:hypothetical protein